MLKLGKTPARSGAYGSVALVNYLTTALPPAPAIFGHADVVTEWGMDGNDNYGDCVWAGADHEHLYWNAQAKKLVSFSTETALADYAAVTGFNPNDPNSDQGTDMAQAAKYRRTVGVIDGNQKRHKIDAYLALPGISARGRNSVTMLGSLASAAYVFGVVGVGIEFPSSAMGQFNTGQPWDVVEGASIEGGHYVPLIGRNAAGNFLVVTWGKVQEVTPAFLEAYVDEALVYLNHEQLVNGVGIDGFDLAALQADLAALGGTPAPTPTPSPTPVPTDPLAEARAVLDPWAKKSHTGSNKKAAAAWAAYSASV
jgi:hypothetical protein